VKLWRRFLHWIARREIAEERASLADERDRLDRCAELLRVNLSAAPRGTSHDLQTVLDEACERALPVGITWEIRFQKSPYLAPGQILITVETGAGVLPRSAA